VRLKLLNRREVVLSIIDPVPVVGWMNDSRIVRVEESTSSAEEEQVGSPVLDYIYQQIYKHTSYIVVSIDK